eukprot:TRINITY_DN13943_c0_g1_i1.p1 TRINITY_DN13943_c0_g1~~TRINITY_DN13943_c0_g1_i1.p1  ORF type:complete len:917 (+),score=208.86 TRINITY_DN13943_c0_g1_i1:74-2824(+)
MATARLLAPPAARNAVRGEAAGDTGARDSEVQALRAENAALHKKVAALQTELRGAVDASLQCMGSFRAAVALAERYALMARARCDDPANAELQQLVNIAGSTQGSVRERPVTPVSQEAVARPAGGSVAQPPEEPHERAHPLTPVQLGRDDTPARDLAEAYGPTPARAAAPQPQQQMDATGAFSSYPGTPATPSRAQVLVHESPPLRTTKFCRSDTVPVTPLGGAAPPAGRTPSVRLRTARCLPCKRLRRAQLDPDGWAEKGQQADLELLRAAGAPPCALAGRLEPMLRSGKVFKLQSLAEDGTAELAFYNATPDTQFTLEYEFGPQSVLLPASEDVQCVGSSVYVLTVYPGETKRFVRGRVNGYQMNMRYGAVGDSYLARLAEDSEAKVHAQLAAMQQKCGFSQEQCTAEEAARRCISERTTFIDASFPPLPASLRREWEGGGPPRPWVSLGLPLQLYARESLEDSVDPSDLEPGALGDLWLTGALAALAEWPSLVAEAFERPYLVPGPAAPADDATVGVCRARVAVGGWWQTVVVDSWVPAGGIGPAFCRGLTYPQSAWAPMLQKVLAKVYGSYSCLRLPGDPVDALSDLTGFAGERLRWPQGGEVQCTQWERVVELCRRGCIVMLHAPGGTDADGDDEALRDRYLGGIALGAAHVVLRAEAAAGGLRLLQLRNAWGDASRWRGDWGDASPRWAERPEVRRQCGHTGGGDGTMWLCWEEALRTFCGGSVCYYSPRAADVRVRVNFSNGLPDVCCAISGAGACSLVAALHQGDTRSSPPDDPQSRYGAYCVSVVEPVGEREWTLAAASNDGTFWRWRDVVVSTPLVPKQREYYVIPRAYDEARSASVTLSLVMDACVGTVSFLRPSAQMLEAMMYEPIFAFDPGQSTAASPLVQVSRGDAQSLSSVSLSVLHSVQT